MLDAELDADADAETVGMLVTFGHLLTMSNMRHAALASFTSPKAVATICKRSLRSVDECLHKASVHNDVTNSLAFF